MHCQKTDTLIVNRLLKRDENDFVSENVISTITGNIYDSVTLIVEFEFKQPETIDYISTFVPRTYNIDLLDLDALLTNDNVETSITEHIDLLDTHPVINNIGLLDQSVKKTFFLRNINLSEIPEPSQVDVPEFTTTVSDMHVDAIDTEITCLYQNKDEDTIESLSEDNNKLYNKLKLSASA